MPSEISALFALNIYCKLLSNFFFKKINIINLFIQQNKTANLQ